MEAQSVERKLAAIFAADVEGYSRLMGRSYRGKRIPPCRCGKAKGLLHAPPKRIIINLDDYRSMLFDVRGDRVPPRSIVQL